MIKQLDSYGRRRKRSIDLVDKNNTEDELVVMQTIKIMDSFHSNNNTRKRNNKFDSFESWEWSANDGQCTNLFTIIIVCSLFLIGQLLIICVFVLIWNRNKHQTRSQFKRQILNSDLHSLSNFTTSSIHSLDYSTVGSLPRTHLIYSNPFNNSTSSIQPNKHLQSSTNLRSTTNNVPNFMVNKNMSKLNTHLFNQEPSAIFNSNLFH